MLIQLRITTSKLSYVILIVLLVSACEDDDDDDDGDASCGSSAMSTRTVILPASVTSCALGGSRTWVSPPTARALWAGRSL